MDAVSSTGVAAGLGVLIGAMLPIVPPPGPGDLLTPAILGGLMSTKRKSNPVIGDPKQLLANFRAAVRTFARNEEIAHGLLQFLRTIEANPYDPMLAGQWSTSRYNEVATIYVSVFSLMRIHGAAGGNLFLAILQQLALPPAIGAKVQACARFWSRNAVRPAKLKWKNVGPYGIPRHAEYVVAYHKILAELRKQEAIAEEAIRVGTAHAVEGSETRLKAGPFTLVNTGNFSAETMKEAAEAVEQAANLLSIVGLERLCYGEVLVSQRLESRPTVLAFYLVRHDEMFVRANVPKRYQHDLVATICHELAHRLEAKFLDAAAKAKIVSVYRTLKATGSLQEPTGPSPGDTLPYRGDTLVVTRVDRAAGKVFVTFQDDPSKRRLGELPPTPQTLSVPIDKWPTVRQKKRQGRFVTVYASTDASENFAEMVAFYAAGKLPPDQVKMLLQILGDTSVAAQRDVELAASVSPSEYAAIVETPADVRQANPVQARHHAALSLAEVKRWEPLAAASGVSEVARGPSGFLTAYKRAGGRLDHLSEAWRAKREAFIARHMAQAENESLFADGLPTRRHLALIMWAYSPDASRLKKANPRKANPVGPLPEGLRFERTHEGMIDRDQHRFVVKAYVPGREKWVGRVSYDVVGNVGHIDFVSVDAAYARLGIATAMYRYLAEKEPDLLWDRGMATTDGGHFREATRDILPLVPKRLPPIHALLPSEVVEHYGADEDQLMDEYVAWASDERARGAEDVLLFDTWVRDVRPPHRKANPVDNDATLALLKEAAGDSAKVKWREEGGAREYMIVAHGKDEVLRIAATLGNHGALTEHDFYASPEDGYRALHLRLPSGEAVQVKTARMATLAYAAQGVSADGQVDTDAFRKICDLASYADEGDAHAARRFDEIPVTELRSQITR
jgi:hypothetical protein